MNQTPILHPTSETLPGPSFPAQPLSGPESVTCIMDFDSVKRLLRDRPLRRPKRTGEKVYRVLVRLIPEEDGFSVYSPTLPGAASQGDTEAEAIANIREAVAGLIQSYRDRGKAIPWDEEFEDCPAGQQERWVSVNA